MSEILSKEKKINQIYSQIVGVFDPATGITLPRTSIVEPGDLVFIITHYPYKTLKSEVAGKGWREAIRIRLRARWRVYLGFDRNDWDDWHVAIYFQGKQRKDHKRINPYIIHVTGKTGVQSNQISPRYFTNEDLGKRSRIEILQFEGIKNEQRKEIVDFALSKMGLSFDLSFVRNAKLTYAFGLPNLRHDQSKITCQQLAIAAYAAAGIYFTHPYQSFPICNIGRFLGHPLGHPKDRVDPKYPYLCDHHIYRDPRFVLKAVVYQDTENDEIKIETENLAKYSWNEALRNRYLSYGYL